MASTNKTKRLGLSNWANSDKPTMDDFNKDNQTIDDKMAILSKAGSTNWDSGNIPIEEGVWTPNIANSGLDITSSEGKYFRQGRFIYIACDIRFSGASTNTNNDAMLISGLPSYSWGNTLAFPARVASQSVQLPSNGSTLTASMINNGLLRIDYSLPNGGYNTCNWNMVKTAGWLVVGMLYITK